MFHFQGPKGFLAQVSEVTPAVRKQYNKMAVLHFFELIPLFSLLLLGPGLLQNRVTRKVRFCFKSLIPLFHKRSYNRNHVRFSS